MRKRNGHRPGEVHLSPVHIRVRARAPTRNKRTSPDVRQATLIEIQTNEMTSSRPHQNGTSASGLGSQLSVGLRAGIPAVLLNTALLGAADAVGIVTARGGLLKLLLTLAGYDHTPGIAGTWIFQQLFHVAVGIAMVIVYGLLLGSWRAPALLKGVLAAAIVWLLNAGMVLPMLGEGFAGSRVLTASGVAAFAVAHTLFFVVGAVLHERWKGRTGEIEHRSGVDKP
ncbi:hypothetical protein [Burkholderia gladioli]|uniref:hypothetical protein n=1 Tax=Burkholderia gladioli TaxID=28095 RepID=UPI000ADD00F3|nr:hypothetical protein [Burkholderia gladioli]